MWMRSTGADTHQFSLLNLSVKHIVHPISLDTHTHTHTHSHTLTRILRHRLSGTFSNWLVMTFNPHFSCLLHNYETQKKINLQLLTFSLFNSCLTSHWPHVCVGVGVGVPVAKKYKIFSVDKLCLKYFQSITCGHETLLSVCLLNPTQETFCVSLTVHCQWVYFTAILTVEQVLLHFRWYFYVRTAVFILLCEQCPPQTQNS